MSAIRYAGGVLFAAAALAAQAATPVQTGVVHVHQVDDFDHGHFEKYYELELFSGERVRLDAPPTMLRELRTGTPIQVTGQRLGSVLGAVESIVSIAPAPGIEIPEPAPLASGDRSAVVLVVDFSDSTVTCSDNTIEEIMWTGSQSIDGLYRATSHGTLAFPRDTDNDNDPDLHRVTIDASVQDGCEASSWANAADQAALAQGVNMSLYQHRVYVIPGNNACSWAGLGSLGCFGSCRSWVATCGLPDVYAHELGHNLGLHHASTDDDNDGELDCEYCDRSDFMGIGGVGYRQLNGPHMEQMGWIPDLQIRDISNVVDTTYQLASLETDPGTTALPHVLKLGKPGTEDSYYLSYRVRAGYDANLNGSYHSRLNIHRWDGSGQTLFIDALADGETFTDTDAGISITQLSQSQGVAQVLVGSDCLAAAPGLQFNPSQQTGMPGEQQMYTLQVTNQDDSSCAGSRFDLTVDAPAGWNTSLSTDSVALNPGATTNVTMQVTPPAASPDGTFEVDVDAAGPAPEHVASATATYNVVGETPDAPSDVAGYAGRRGTVMLHWTASPGPVAGYRIYRDNTLIAVTQNLSWIDTRACANSCQFDVRAVDGSGRESSSATINVTIPRGRKGPGRALGASNTAAASEVGASAGRRADRSGR